MPEELLERIETQELAPTPSEDSSLVPPAPPEGLDTALFERDDRSARTDLRRQIAAMESELGELFASAFPRTGIEFKVAAPGGGPRILSVNELERVRDSLASRVSEVKTHLDEYGRAEEASREMIERMTADPAGHKWLRVSNEHIGEPGCRHWHSRPRWGILGMAMGWWRVKVSSGCPLAEAGLRPVPHQDSRSPDLMATKRSRKRRKQRRQGLAEQPQPGAAAEAPAETRRRSSATTSSGSAPRAGPRATTGRRAPPWGSFPLSELDDPGRARDARRGLLHRPAARRHPARDRARARVAGRAGARGARALLGLPLAHPPARRSRGDGAGGRCSCWRSRRRRSRLPPPESAALGVSAYFFAGAFRRRSGGALFKIR